MSSEINEEWPTRINVMKVISYDVETIFDQIKEDNRATGEELNIELDDIIEMIHNYALDDMSCGWGHQAKLNELIFQDENGEEY